MFEKPFRFVDTVFIHCSASDRPEDDDVAVIKQWHLDRGWHDIGYHFFIRKDGTVQEGRDLEKIPAAQKGYNVGSIAICIHGLELANFTNVQLSSLRELCREINGTYEGKIRFRAHNEVNKFKTCPVINVQKVLNLDKDGTML